MKHLILFLLVFVSVNSLFSQEVKISPDHKRIRLGEEIKVTLESKAKPSQKVIWPSLKDTLGEHFTILGQSKFDTLSDEGGDPMVIQQNISITSFDSGSFQIPSLPFGFVTGSDTQKVYTDPLSFSILTVPVDTTLAIKDVYGIVDVPFEIGEYIPWIVGGLVLLAILIAGIYLYLNKRKPAQLQEKKVVVIPWQFALEELERIEKESVWKSGKLKLYYSEISDNVRTYFENQFDIPALESTTEEILIQIKQRSWDENVIAETKELLVLSDLVKFAKESPGEVTHARSLLVARNIIESTKPAIIIIEKGKEEKDE
ncbi:MAG: hypothetical protein WED33_10645 [Bacteroidia bacterium]